MQATSFPPQQNGKIFSAETTRQQNPVLIPQVRIHPDYLRTGRRSLSGIGEHAFAVGITFGIAIVLAAQLFLSGHYLWRIPFFFSTLATFHFLEFDMTAKYNTPDAKVSSFLLFSNGWAYNMAHSMAIVETLVRFWLSRSSLQILPISLDSSNASVLSSACTITGICLIAAGQLIRSLAMKQAGTSFNHLVQSSQKEDHVLITHGIYAISRHPAYCGFFWWGLGTQLMLGNTICFFAYSAILWKFFAHRIVVEERHLNAFFGQEYATYRAATPVRIPFI